MYLQSHQAGIEIFLQLEAYIFNTVLQSHQAGIEICL